MRKNEEDQGTVILRYGKTILIGGLLGFCAGLIFLFALSICIAQGFLDVALSYQFTVVGSVLGGFCGGLFSARQSNKQSPLIGLLSGTVVFLLQLSLGLLLFDAFSFENGGLGLLCGALCGGAAAGMIGVGKKGHGRGKKHHKR